MKSFAVIALASCLTLVTAQYYPVPDPYDIDNSTKETWCIQQQASCDGLCQDEFQGNADTNDCFPDDLQYQCICPGGLSPNNSEYSMWIPYQLCQLSVQGCSDNCNGDSKCSQTCFSKKCGAINPTRVNVTTTASTPTATGGSKGGDSTDSADASPTGDAFNINLASSLTELGSSSAFGAIIVGVVIGLFGVL